MATTRRAEAKQEGSEPNGKVQTSVVGDANKINGFRTITVFLHDPI
jgi:hypothetical protein